MLQNNNDSYELIHIAFHWLTALGVFTLFGLGLYMVDLGYYDPWYHRAPALHKSIGLLLFVLVVGRLIWVLVNSKPIPLATRRWERVAAKAVHFVLYFVLLLVLLSGYLIAAADGRAIPVFDWFSVPGYRFWTGQEDVAGDVHEIAAWLLIGLVAFHALGALKHHFVDRDATLKRMLWPRR